MEKIILTSAGFLLLNLIPSVSIAQGTGELAVHTEYALYVLLILLFVLFTSVIFLISTDDKKLREEIVFANETRFIPMTVNSGGAAAIVRSFNLISYLVYALLVIYLLIFFTMII